MPYFKFTSNYDFAVRRFVVRAYKAGGVYLISQEAAKQALSKGVAFPVDRPHRKPGKADVVGK